MFVIYSLSVLVVRPVLRLTRKAPVYFAEKSRAKGFFKLYSTKSLPTSSSRGLSKLRQQNCNHQDIPYLSWDWVSAALPEKKTNWLSHRHQSITAFTFGPFAMNQTASAPSISLFSPWADIKRLLTTYAIQKRFQHWLLAAVKVSLSCGPQMEIE